MYAAEVGVTVSFSADRIFRSILSGIEAAVNETTAEIAATAIEKAPVRKVFKGSVGKATLQSIEEAAAEAHLRSGLGLAPGRVRTQRTAASRIHTFGPRRILIRPGRLQFNTPLTSRGRYELKSGRANFKSGGKNYLGGRLRGEIRAEPAETDGQTVIGRAVSPTPYAKFVELGTHRSRAQPYLRPAIAQQREAFRARLAKVIR
jgi:HK97 gp10 family phage protein